MEKSDAPEGGENWFILMNVPANEGQDWDALVAKMRKNVISKITFSNKMPQIISEIKYNL